MIIIIKCSGYTLHMLIENATFYCSYLVRKIVRVREDTVITESNIGYIRRRRLIWFKSVCIERANFQRTAKERKVTEEVE